MHIHKQLYALPSGYLSNWKNIDLLTQKRREREREEKVREREGMISCFQITSYCRRVLELIFVRLEVIDLSFIKSDPTGKTCPLDIEI